MMGMTFGEDLGPKRVTGMKADHHCEVFIDGERYGYLYKGNGIYEYRGRPVGVDELSWVARIDKRDVITALVSSLEKRPNLEQAQKA